MDARCRIELFGELRLLQGDRILTRFRTQKTALLLAYMALHRRQPHLRDRLVDLFWPELDLDTGRNNLSTVLSYLRRSLEPPGIPAGSLLLADRQHVQLNPDAVSTDVAEFDQLLQTAAHTQEPAGRASLLERAVGLYRGELLPGCCEEWALLEQARCSERYADALEQWAAALEQIGDLEAGLAVAKRAVQADPYREEPYRAQMRLYATLGRAGAALTLFGELERVLNAEMGVSPSPDTRALAEQLRRDPGAVAVRRVLPRRAPGTGHRAPERSDHEPAAPPRGAPALPFALPLPLTRFFGREREIAHLSRWLREPETRLVTLTGSGGCGKTRLALEVVRQSAPEFAGRVWFVDLAPLPDPSLIPAAVAGGLRLPPTRPDQDPLDRVVEALGESPCLLLLDNFEHLLRREPPSLRPSGLRLPFEAAGGGEDPGETMPGESEGSPSAAPGGARFEPGGGGPRAPQAVVRLLLERVPGLTCLVTSRQPLHLSGEHEFPVLPLVVPERSDTPARLLACSSVALYVDRAQSVRPDFSLTPQNAAAVGALCRKLEGMPLAIEMAAAWAKTLPPVRMLERLEDKLDLLVSRQRDLPPRQQSLRATFEWSYELLSPEQQACFAQLSVFRGGWTLEAAEAVCGAEALTRLSELQEQSLIVVEEREEAGGAGGAPWGPDPGRFRLLEPLREYAGEKLAEPREREAVRGRHAAYFLALAETQPRGGGPAEGRWLDCMEREYENLRAARDWFADAGHPELELRLAEAVQYLWEVRGHGRDARAWVEHALGGLVARDETRARALYLAGRMAWRDGNLSLAQRCLEESLAIMREVENPQGIGDMVGALGDVAYARQDYDTARALWEEGLAIMREVSDKQGMANCLVNLGGLAREQGDLAAARRHLEECGALDEEMGVRGGHVLWLLGVLAREEGDAEEARRLWRQHLMECQEFHPARCVWVLGELASYAVADGQLEQGARLWGAVSALRERLDPSLPIVLPETYERERSLLRARLGEAGFEAAFAEGGALTLEQAIEYALAGPA